MSKGLLYSVHSGLVSDNKTLPEAISTCQQISSAAFTWIHLSGGYRTPCLVLKLSGRVACTQVIEYYLVTPYGEVELGHYWIRHWLFPSSAPIHYLNQRWVIFKLIRHSPISFAICRLFASGPIVDARKHCGQIATFLLGILFHLQNIWLEIAECGKVWTILATSMVTQCALLGLMSIYQTTTNILIILTFGARLVFSTNSKSGVVPNGNQEIKLGWFKIKLRILY